MRRESQNGLSTEVIVKDEPYDDSGDDKDQILNIVDIKTEIADSFLNNVTFKKVLEDLTRESNALAKVSEEEFIEHHNIKFETDVSIKQEEEWHQNLYSSVDILNKHVKIILPRFKCFMCEHCPAYYKKKKDLLCHIYSEHYLLFRNSMKVTKSQHYCSICEKKLTYKLWHSHMTIVHTQNFQWKCEVCNKVFKHKTYLKRHKKYVHENLKPSWRFRKNIVTPYPMQKWLCLLCSKEFNNKHSLHTHTKNCHSEKAYPCKLCNSILKCKSYLYTHMRRVHYDDGKVHSCNLCHKQFRSPRYLKIHKKNSHK